jgi:hypothetical protein
MPGNAGRGKNFMAITVSCLRLKPEDKEFLQNLAQKNNLIWGQQPNLTAAIRLLISREKGQQNREGEK